MSHVRLSVHGPKTTGRSPTIAFPEQPATPHPKNKPSQRIGTEFGNPGSHAHTKAHEVRISNRLCLRPISLEKRTSAPFKGVKRQAIYGTVENHLTVVFITLGEPLAH